MESFIITLGAFKAKVVYNDLKKMYFCNILGTNTKFYAKQFNDIKVEFERALSTL